MFGQKCHGLELSSRCVSLLYLEYRLLSGWPLKKNRDPLGTGWWGEVRMGWVGVSIGGSESAYSSAGEEEGLMNATSLPHLEGCSCVLAGVGICNNTSSQSFRRWAGWATACFVVCQSR